MRSNSPSPDRTSRREVRVTDPDLSGATRRQLTDDVREVIGDDHVDVPVDRARPSQGEGTGGSHPAAAIWSTNKLLPIIIGLMFLVVGVLLSATTGSWWFMAAAVFVDLVGVLAVAGLVLRMTATQERPHPATVAAMEEDGVVDAEGRFSEIVAEYTPAHRGDNEHDGRDTAVEDDPLKAGAEHASSGTPTSGASRPVGPGRRGPRGQGDLAARRRNGDSDAHGR